MRFSGVILSLVCLLQQLGATCDGCGESLALWEQEPVAIAGCCDDNCSTAHTLHMDSESGLKDESDRSAPVPVHLCSAVHLLFSPPSIAAIWYPPQPCELYFEVTALILNPNIDFKFIACREKGFFDFDSSVQRCASLHLLQI